MPELVWRFLGSRGDIQRWIGDFDAAYQDYRAAIESIESMRDGLTLEEHRIGFVTEVREKVYTGMITLLTDRTALWCPTEALAQLERVRSWTFLEQLAGVGFGDAATEQPLDFSELQGLVRQRCESHLLIGGDE
jgi:hypothetical protein